MQMEAGLEPSTAILLINSPDRRGLVATVANFLYARNANILHADQHRDDALGLFFMRVEWDLAGFEPTAREFEDDFRVLAAELQLAWTVQYSSEKPAVAIFVSRYLHCLVDLLHRHQNGELACTIPCIVSNHQDAKPLADFYRIPFHFLPAAERDQLNLMDRERIELIVLARYMQILSPEFVRRYPSRIINVHHSFLPAFSGARPYQAAFQRGVKLIGATSHYVTEALDEGPIIDQDVERVSHRDRLQDLVQKGKDLERVVLSRAVKWHLEHRILSYANKTVVFD
jgi:formyltetrahydrofolate deformylase